MEWGGAGSEGGNGDAGGKIVVGAADARMRVFGQKFCRGRVPLSMLLAVAATAFLCGRGLNPFTPISVGGSEDSKYDFVTLLKEVRDKALNTSQSGSQPPSDTDYVDLYLRTAQALSPTTDKVTTHTYQVMYGQYLLPYYYKNPKMKMLEIGLGCDMNYGPGASVALFEKLFPEAELWEAEYNAACVENSKKKGQLEAINTLTGDQGNDTVLDGWVETSGGNFDVVIDDGGHQNCQIWHSFVKLWPTVKPGGLYFIEDMQVAKWNDYRKAHTDKCDRDLIMPEKLKMFFDNLMYDTSRKSDLEFMFCQSEACVLGKRNDGREHVNALTTIN